MAEVTEIAIPVQTSRNLARTIRIFSQGLVFAVLWCAALFLFAGDIAWLRGWIASLLYFVAMATTGVLVRRGNPGLLERRSKWIKTDTKSFDRIFLRIIFPLSLMQPAIAGLDVVRFGWAGMPDWTIYPGILLFVLASGLIDWVMLTNPHAETSVRIQFRQTPITSGPYRLVRHPMYAGSILMYAAKALILGSAWALAVALLITILFVWRTFREDRTLSSELPGYDEYTGITRYRMIPGIW